MNINNLYGNLSSSALTNVGNVGAVGTPTAGVSSIPPAPGAATASISTPAQFFSELQQMSQQDPTKFKAVAAQLATSFQNAASQASGPQAKLLGNIANQLSQAAQTGSLQPPQGASSGQAVQGAQAGGGAHAHHGHHHHGGGSMQGSDASSQVQQAFQNAMGILAQATQSSTSTSSTSTSSL